MGGGQLERLEGIPDGVAEVIKVKGLLEVWFAGAAAGVTVGSRGIGGAGVKAGEGGYEECRGI